MNKRKYNEYLEMVKNNGFSLGLIPSKYKTKEICLEAVKQNGWELEFAEKQDREICLEAVRENGWALKFVEKQDREICLTAIKESGWALQFVKEQDIEICLEAIMREKDLSLLRYIDKKYIDEVTKKLDVFYLPRGDEHRELIIDSNRRCWIGCQEDITIERLMDRIYNEDGGLKENPHRKHYIDFLKDNNLI